MCTHECDTSKTCESTMSEPELHCLNQKLGAQKRKHASDGRKVKWEDLKYDTILILNAMSDDKDDPDQLPSSRDIGAKIINLALECME